MRRRVEDALIERQIEPASELESGMADGPAIHETTAFMQSDAHGVVAVDARDKRVVLLRDRTLDHRLQ